MEEEIDLLNGPLHGSYAPVKSFIDYKLKNNIYLKLKHNSQNIKHTNIDYMGANKNNLNVTDFSINNILGKELSRKSKGDCDLTIDLRINNDLEVVTNKIRVLPLNSPIAGPWAHRSPLIYKRQKCSTKNPDQMYLNDENNNFCEAAKLVNVFHSDINSDSAVVNDAHYKVTILNLNDNQIITEIKPEMKDLDQEMSRQWKEMTTKCEICQKMFTDELALKAHTSCHAPRYWCSDCGKGFSQLRNFRYHISVHRGTGEFRATCPECGKSFNDRGYLSSHMKIHRNRKEYACPHCPKCFNQRVAYNMHVRIHTGVKPHKCQDCGKSFSRKMLLRQHSRTHSGEKPYECPQCRKPFADRSNMTLHLRLHSGVKPFSCPMCPKSFSKKHHLKTHMNYHTGSKPYTCPHPPCGQSFSQSSNMRTHAKKCKHNKDRLSSIVK